MQWSSKLNSPIPVHFSSLIPKMLMFTLGISCLTTSNIPWFMDLLSQIPMRYCSSQHWTLLSAPDTSTAKCHFHFGPADSLLLKLLVIALHSSPVAYCTLSSLEAQGLIFLHFPTVHGVLQARILERVVISSSSRPHVVRTLHYDPSILGDSAQPGS